MTVALVVGAAVAVILTLWTRGLGRKAPVLGSMSDQWMAEQQVSRRP